MSEEHMPDEDRLRELPRTPKLALYQILCGVLNRDVYDEYDAWDLAGTILDGLTDEDVQHLAEIREVPGYRSDER